MSIGPSMLAPVVAACCLLCVAFNARSRVCRVWRCADTARRTGEAHARRARAKRTKCTGDAPSADDRPSSFMAARPGGLSTGRTMHFSARLGDVPCPSSGSPRAVRATCEFVYAQGGACTVGSDVHAQNPRLRVGVHVASNAGRPGGLLGLRGELDHRQVHCNHRTHEEDVVSNWLLSEVRNPPCQRRAFAAPRLISFPPPVRACISARAGILARGIGCIARLSIVAGACAIWTLPHLTRFRVLITFTLAVLMISAMPGSLSRAPCLFASPLSLVTSRAVPCVLVCFALSLVTPRAVLCVRVCVSVGLFVRRRFVRRRGNHGLPEPRASLYCPSMMAAGFRARWFSLRGSSLAVPLPAPTPLGGCFARKVLGCFSCQPVCLGWWLCCPCACRPNAGAARRSVGSMARTRNLRCVDDYPFFRSAVAATLCAALDAMVHDGALPALRVSVRACRLLCCACCVRAWLL